MSVGVALAADAVGALAGAWVGLCVTERLHGDRRFWGRQIGRTRFRWANLPVGCVAAFSLAEILPPGLAEVARCVGAGMGVTAVGWAWVDPAPAPIPW